MTPLAIMAGAWARAQTRAVQTEIVAEKIVQ